MGKKKKINKKKFISRILMLVIIFAILILLCNIIFKKDVEVIASSRLILDNQDITDNLEHSIYIDNDKNLYMSVEDIKNVFDNNLYFEESSEKIITTSDTKVGAIDLNNNTFELNSATLLLSSGVIKYDTYYAIPVSDITSLYNIEIYPTEDTAVICSLYKELITTKTTKKVSLKENTSIFSSTIQKLENDKEVIYIENAEKAGWIKVLTYEGNIGYIKEKNVSEKEYKRTNMEESDFSDNSADINNAIELTKSAITEENLKDFSSRKKTIEDIIAKIISKEKYTVNLNMKDVDVDNEKLERFIIELIPRLKEIGGSVVVTNNNILDNEFLEKNNL